MQCPAVSDEVEASLRYSKKPFFVTNLPISSVLAEFRKNTVNLLLHFPVKAVRHLKADLFLGGCAVIKLNEKPGSTRSTFCI